MLNQKGKFAIFFISIIALISASCFLLDKYYFNDYIWKSAINYYYSGQHQKAISTFEKSSNYFKYTSLIKVENAQKYIELQYRLAISYLKTKDYTNAERAINEGQNYLIKKYGKDSIEFNTYSRIGLIAYYIAKEEFQLAQELLEKTHSFYLKNQKIGTELASIKRLYGDMYYAQKEYNLALEYYKEAYKLANEHKFLNTEASIKLANKIANIYINNNKHNEAINIYNGLINIIEKRNIKNDALLAYINWEIAKTYKAGKLYNEAVPYFLLAINDAGNIEGNSILKHNTNDIKKDLAETYLLLNKHEEAKILLEEISNK